MNQILVIEDDRFLQRSIKQVLEMRGFTVRLSSTASEGFLAIAEAAPDLLILDLGLPDEDGISLCKRIRQKWRFPIVILSSRSDLTDKVIGLEVGADDYLTKPFEAGELIARVRANLRRQEEYSAVPKVEEVLSVGPLKMDLGSRTVHVGESPVHLTSLEFKLLHLLATNSGRVLERETLFEQVWGYDDDFNSNSLEVFVYRLRSKLEKAAGLRMIETVRGVGYRLTSG